MHLGEQGDTFLEEPLGALEVSKYKVFQFRVDDPADHDRDGINDVVEYNQPESHSPFNAAPEIDRFDGVVQINDAASFSELSFKRHITILGDSLSNLEVVKFYYLKNNTDNPEIYFINAHQVHIAHSEFAEAIDLTLTGNEYRGQIVYHPDILSENGTLGVYRVRFQPTDIYEFDIVQEVHEMLAKNCPFMKNNFCYYPMPPAVSLAEEESILYDDSRICLLFESDLYADIDYIPLNLEVGYGLLRILEPNELPNSRDIVLLETIPNELSHVAGIITTIPQTPLSHVNLRAIQDKVPNAFIRHALEEENLTALIGKHVKYSVDEFSYRIEETTKEEVDAHFESRRPAEESFPLRNLDRTEILSLQEISFDMSDSFGPKCSNVATMHQFGMEAGVLPEGFGIPFYYYDEFMKFNGFYEDINVMLSDEVFNNDFNVQMEMLKELRSKIKDGDMPEWMLDALQEMHNSFPEGQSVRCRSSSNNEDLPGFIGAGLYTSKTQHPDEGHISKSVKQVYASLWNFAAFDERSYFRIDHASTCMGVLCHANYSNELANGVAVSTDPIYDTNNTYYTNTQLGEDLVTNPEAFSIPEEILITIDTTGGQDPITILRPSNQVPSGESLLSSEYINQLKTYLTTIHREFALLYEAEDKPGFAMEIEFKVTEDNTFAIKQARPWADFWSNNLISTEADINDQPLTIKLFPNPTSEFLNFKFSLEQSATVEIQIYDLSLREVASPQTFILVDGIGVIRSSVADLPEGIYVAQMIIKEKGSTYSKAQYFIKS